MDPVTGGIIGAGIAGGLGVGGGVLGNKARAEEAAKNRRFQKKMYRHRYQYTVEDMRRAGLNPALAYQQGAGSSPGGSQANQEDVVGAGLEAGGRAVSSALAVKTAKAQIANIQAQTEKTQVETIQLASEGEFRRKWWEGRPEAQATGTLYTGMRWRTENLVREFLDQTLTTRVEMQGLQREELVQILASLKQEIELRGLDRAPLEAQSEFAKSWFGKEVAPYVSSAGGIVGMVSRLLLPFLRSQQGGIGGKPARRVTGGPRRSW